MRSIEAQGRSPPPRAARPSWFAGTTWNGVALIALICIVNGTRRAVRGFGEQSLLEAVLSTMQASVAGLMIAVPVSLAVLLTWNLTPKRPPLRYPLLALAVAASSLFGTTVQHAVEVLLLCDPPGSCWQGPMVLVLSWSRYGVLSALFSAVFVYIRLADESAERAADAERNRARFAQREEEARLRMLQAQIEPHFLFNTLANLAVLIRSDPQRAERMLADLIAWLRATLQRTRETTSTLGDEMALLRSYLDILALRLGERLRFAFDVPEALLSQPFPLLLLQPLVENAITHGIEPKVGGGELRIAAGLENGRLRIVVSDTGVGLREAGSGSGFGLENVRQRLRALFGKAASLDIRGNAGGGVAAVIELPA